MEHFKVFVSYLNESRITILPFLAQVFFLQNVVIHIIEVFFIVLGSVVVDTPSNPSIGTAFSIRCSVGVWIRGKVSIRPHILSLGVRFE